MRYSGAILDDYYSVALQLADWSRVPEVAFKVFNQPFRGSDEVIAALQGAGIICVMRERTSFPRRVIEGLPDLKLIVTGGMRNAAIDVQAAAERGIMVCGTKSAGYSTGELTFGLILELSRRIGFQDRQLKAGVPWQTVPGHGIFGRTIGIIGLGKIGSRVARIAQACDMKVIAWSQNLTAERCREVGATLVSKEELLRQSDFVTIHVQLSPRTQGMIGAADLALMKPTAYLINTSRAQIVDQDALLAALREKKIAGAGLDVYDVEPLPLDHPLRKLPNAVTTPHLGYATLDNFRLFYEGMVEDIRAWIDGKPINVIPAR
ncbi:MAG TPA: D-2-hydroxyacid dehydrogenase family protein [Xanthobacteraceae bacterium]|nr:D-2-hydroxyacid dehydrogenase family protein [Xanthobacteraceae bacterium]